MTAQQQETHQLTIVYAGARQSSKAKPNHLWVVGEHLDDESSTLAFQKLGPGCVIGGVYTVEADDPDGSRVYPTSAEYVGRKVDDPERVAAWEALDRAARDAHARAAAERKAARDSELEFALKPAQRIVNHARSRHEALAMADVIRQRLVDGWWDR